VVVEITAADEFGSDDAARQPVNAPRLFQTMAACGYSARRIAADGTVALPLPAADVAALDASINVAFVPLAAVRDPDLVPITIAQVLSVRDAGQLSVDQSIVNAIGDRELLLVLDNFEQVLDAAPVVNALLLACARLTILVTSRSILHISGEHSILVRPLATVGGLQRQSVDGYRRVDAVRLFVQRATAANDGFVLDEENAPAVAAICAHLDGLPLAIELAAARVRMLSPHMLLVRLQESRHMLTGGPRDQPARLRTMYAAIAWSHDLLRDDERLVFRRLAIFAGGWTLDTAEAICGPEVDIVTASSTLLDHSLIQREDPADATSRLRMLEPIREFAEEQLDRSGEADDVRSRHASLFFSMLEESWEHPHIHLAQSNTMSRMGRERDNLRVALAWTLEHGTAEQSLHFANLMFLFLDTHGQLGEALGWLARAQGRDDASPGATRAEAVTGAMLIAFLNGDSGQARVLAEESFARWQELGKRRRQAEILTARGYLAQYESDDDGAVSGYTAALELARAVGHTNLIFTNLMNLGDIAYLRGDLTRAEDLSIEALSMTDEDSSQWYLALGNVAQVALAQGDYARAAVLNAKILSWFLTSGNPEGAADALAGFAGVAVAVGQPERAVRVLGAVATWCGTISVNVLAHHGQHKTAMTAARTTLTAEAFERAWTAGTTLSFDDTLAETAAILGIAQQRALGASPLGSAAQTAPGNLTSREIDVLRLIVEGKSNKEIANVLAIGQSTVASHVVNILGKLGVESRTAAATWAMRNGLADPQPAAPP